MAGPGRSATIAALLVVVIIAAACGGGVSTTRVDDVAGAAEEAPATGAPLPDQEPTSAPDPAVTTPTTAPETPQPVEEPAASVTHPIATGTPCVLRLHGNSGSGGIDPDTMVNGPYYAGGAITLLDPISPTTTDENTWWEFDGPYGVYSDNDEHYVALRDFLTEYVDGFDCGPILVWGLSGGAMMAAKLYCKGEDFGGRVWGYYFADPPLDASVVGCTPPDRDDIRTWFVQSQEFIDFATDYVEIDGGACPVAEWGWYCEDGTALLPEEYYAQLGMRPLAVVDRHIEALLGGIPTEHNMWDQLETWWGQYDPSRF